MTKYKKETSRKDRMHNIATAMFQIYETGNDDGARTRTLREHIRRNLAELDDNFMAIIMGESHLGDLRAHGDALGKHGLHLTVVRQGVQGKSERVIFFSKENLKKCQDFLDNEAEPRIF